MKRKINKVGQNTLTVSLPSKWAEKYGIRPKDEVELTEIGPELKISCKRAPRINEYTLELTENEILLKRILIMPYLKGYDVIKINFKKYIQLEFILKNKDLFFGFEVIEQNPNQIILKNIADFKQSEFESMLLRMFNICESLFDDLKEYLKNPIEENAKRIQLLENLITRIDIFCRRSINTGLIENNKDKIGSVYEIVRIIEGIADLINYISHQKFLKKSNLKQYLESIDYLKEAFVSLRKVKYTGKKESYNEYLNISDKINLNLKKLEDDKSNFEIIFVIKDINFKMHDLSEEVALWIS